MSTMSSPLTVASLPGAPSLGRRGCSLRARKRRESCTAPLSGGQHLASHGAPKRPRRAGSSGRQCGVGRAEGTMGDGWKGSEA